MIAYLSHVDDVRMHSAQPQVGYLSYSGLSIPDTPRD